MRVLNCTECNLPGGTIPKYHVVNNELLEGMDSAVEMLHEDCALRNIERYQARKEAERKAAA